MPTTVEEWLRQADYDLETADFMLQGGRRFYAVFMAHLAVEKALKGIYQKRLNRTPPRTHNLRLLVDQAGLQVPTDTEDFLLQLTHAQIATRYTENLAALQREFTPEVAGVILTKSKEVVVWAKTQL